MTQDELEELLQDCPTLYHMAERGSWTSIASRGLLSTTALLDLYDVRGEERRSIEEAHRPAKVSLAHATLPLAVIRDQSPMRDADLRRCLKGGICPAGWYRLLNGKVFFWLNRDRLIRMLNAGAYRNDVHDVLELDARAIFNDYNAAISLCPINSGATKPMAHPRSRESFLGISDYPYAEWRRKRTRRERVVELAIDHSVPDVFRFVTRAVEMQSDTELRTLYIR